MVYFLSVGKYHFRSSRGRLLLLSIVTKVSKSTFFAQRSERSNNHRHNFLLSSVRSCFQNFLLIKSICLSVIITFLLSAVWEVFSHISALRIALTDFTARLCFHQTKSIVSHASLYLPFTNSQSDSRWSLIFMFWLVWMGVVC